MRELTPSQMITHQLLGGCLELPARDQWEQKYGITNTKLIASMFNALWNRYLLDKGTINATLWYKKFPSSAVFNHVLRDLTKNNWIISKVQPERNWAEIQLNEDKLLYFVTPEELANTRGANKFRKYVPSKRVSEVCDLVRQNGKVKRTGLVREGFTLAANSEYQLALDKLRSNLDMIVLNTIKGMTKVREIWPEMTSDHASYDYVATEIVKSFLEEPRTYNMLGNKSDSRGRAIKDALSKIGNPIGYKDFRSLLVIPEYLRNEATSKGVYAIYLFIAELCGYREGPSSAHKAKYGRTCYQQRKLHELNMVERDVTELPEYSPELTPSQVKELARQERLRAEADRSELHENIWLERLYEDLDTYFNNLTERKLSAVLGQPVPAKHKWLVPLELDASASMLQYEGALLNDDTLLRMTNVIGKEITDPWHLGDVPRKALKASHTPRLYGSMQSIPDLVQSAGFTIIPDDANPADYTTDKLITRSQLRELAESMTVGKYATADALKNLLINYCKPEETMQIRIWDEEFSIECNRFRNLGDSMKMYSIYDSALNEERRIVHTDTIKVADLNQFKRYFATLLVHNLDSQVANRVAYKVYEEYGFCIDIHDAFIVCPEAALLTRRTYRDQLESIRDNGETILRNYMTSIGIGSEVAQAWTHLQSLVKPAKEAKFSLMALK